MPRRRDRPARNLNRINRNRLRLRQLAGVGLLGRRDGSHRFTTDYGVPLLGTVFEKSHANSRRFVGFGTERHDVGDVDRHFFVQTSALGIALTGPHVLVHHVDPLDQHLFLLVVHRQYFSGLAFVAAADDLDHVARLNFHFDAFTDFNANRK